MVDLVRGGRYEDIKYGCELIVEYFDDSVVLARDVTSGHTHLYKREEFLNKEDRFNTKE